MRAAFRNINCIEAVEALQKDLEVLYTWQKNNNMKFNSTKFELLCYGPNMDVKDESLYFTPMMTDVIESKMELRDLGVTMSDDFYL